MSQDRIPATGERRRAVRQKSLLRGTVYFNNRRSAIDCVIRDITVHGARLVFSDAVGTPDAFDLYIPQKDQTLHAQVIWRQSHEAGIAFAQNEVSVPDTGGELSERVQRLEAEIAALKRLVRQMRNDRLGDSDAA